jgi:RHS repeat-associated protein
MDEIQDAGGNAYSIQYNSLRQPVRITEPAGRYFSISYRTLSGNKLDFTTLAQMSAVPGSGQWVELTITNQTAFRYVRLLQADKSFGNISEVEFYEAGTNVKLSGSVICSDSAAVGSDALDGNPGTAFVSASQSGGFVGYDLGTAKKIGRVRFLCAPGTESLQMPSGWNYRSVQIQAGNEAPLSIAAISQVTTSDGRSVVYQYEPVNDPTLPYVFPVLKSVTFGDGTQSTYGYVQIFPGSKPLVSEWNDVRYSLRQPKYQTVYQNSHTGTVMGAVVSQINRETGNPILQIGIQNNQLHTPTVTYANGGVVVQKFDTSLPTGTNMVEETDANGHKTKYTYDAAGYMATSEDPLGRVTSFTWTAQGNPLTKTHPDGSIESWTYNAQGAVLTHTDQLGRVTAHTRDALDRVTRTDYPNGSYETFAYNAFGQVTSHRLRNGGTVLFGYDARGLLIQKTDPLGNASTIGYDSHDRPNRFTDALGRVTMFECNERGLVTKTTNPDGTFRAASYSAYGDLLTQTNELGSTWTYTYDVFRRITSLTDPLGRITTSVFQPDSYTHKPLAVTTPSGRTVVSTYDAGWNLISKTDGSGTPSAAITSFAYDQVNNVISTTDPLGKVTTAAYDAMDRKISTTDPLGHTTSWTYDAVGNILTTTRPDGGVTNNAFDAMNRLAQTTNPKGESTVMAYDAADNMISMTDPRGSVYSWTYDLLSRPTAMIYPGGSQEQYGYDAVGNHISYTTRAGQIRTSVFDSRNRETQTNWSDSTPDISRTFDALGRVLAEDDGIAQLAFSYDAANQLVSETTALTGQATRTVAYTHDADGRRSTATYPGGNVVSATYTPRGQTSAISLDGGQVAGYEYNAAGNMTAKYLENGTDALYAFDAAQRLIGIEHRKGLDLLASFGYTLDSVGNKKTKTQGGLNPLAETYGYDALDQLTQAKYGTARTVGYTYDASGNRQNVIDNGTGQAYTANALNQYTSVGGSAQAYDANGNLVGTSGAAYSYDAQNRIVSATLNGIVTTFAYDPRNRVVQRNANGLVTNLTYDEWNIIEERDGAGTLQQVYVHGAGVDELLAKITTAGAAYYHADGLGSVIAPSDENGQIKESYTYDAFGAVTIRNAVGSVMAESGEGNRFLFTGREWLKESGIYDYRNRVYSPALGRFLQTDPIRFQAGDVNIYRYVSNNPVNLVDPDGQVFQYFTPVVIAAVSAVVLAAIIAQIIHESLHPDPCEPGQPHTPEDPSENTVPKPPSSPNRTGPWSPPPYPARPAR